ncbi:MAG TPA: hypothetical protein PK490_12250 [Prosthecobacter sp.]|nr:hypothetical protein [Prosthecobacter sp.]
MPETTTNPELLIQGFLRQARLQVAPVAWLNERHAEALSAVAAGDEFVTSTTYQGQASAALRGVPATMLLQIYEACLQRLEAEESAASGIYESPGSVRHADFSGFPSTLG